jgi:Flp pilus assembly protein TadD
VYEYQIPGKANASTRHGAAAAFRWGGGLCLVALLLGQAPARLQGADPVKPAAATPLPVQPPAVPAAPAGASKEERTAAYRQATELAKAADFAGAEKVISGLAPKLAPGDPFCEELRGTVLAIGKDYARAEQAFQRVLAVTPDSHINRFNRAEMVFLQGRYADAEKAFTELEEFTSQRDPAVADLCRFKRILSLLAQGKHSAAEIFVPPVREPNESPALTYARASLAFAKKDLASAKTFLDDAQTRFSTGVANLYTDSLVELHWGQRDSGGRFFFRPKLR